MNHQHDLEEHGKLRVHLSCTCTVMEVQASHLGHHSDGGSHATVSEGDPGSSIVLESILKATPWL